MRYPNNKLLKPENGKLTLFKKAVAVCTSAAITAVFLQSLPPKMRSYAEAVTGETTNGFKYSIEGEKVTITGWTGDKETVTSLTVPATVEGKAVTDIGSGAFEKYPKLTSISIPDTVTELGWGAFASSGLTSITLPARIQKLSYCVFSKCENLKELTLPKDIPEDGMSCSSFYGMGTLSSLSESCIETLIFEDGIEKIPAYCAYSAPELNKLVIPDSVTDIGSYAFYDCNNLVDLDLPSSINTIEHHAFDGCDGLEKVNLPEGVEKIEHEAFGYCDKLTTVVLPSTLKELGNATFIDDTALTSVTLPEGLEKIGMKAFEGCTNLKEITIPSTVTAASYALEKSYIETVHLTDGMEKAPDSLCASTEYVTKIDIPDSVTSLGSRLFANAKGIKEFTVPAQITEGDSVFNSSSLETVHFEEGLTKIPHDFFYYADSLVDINWTSDITEIEYRAFNSCKALETADIPNTVKAIGDSAFSYCDSLKNIHIPENGCKIGAYIFSGCNSLEKAYVPAGLYGEGGEDTYYLLYDCPNLKSVTFGDGVTAIPTACCRACEALTEVTFPAGLETIGYQSFRNCKSLGSVTIPDSVTVISSEAFEFCENLREVKLPAALTNVNSYAFNGCSSLYELSFPKAITTVGNDAFNCGLREAWFEDGIEVIPQNALANAHELRTVHIPGSVTRFGDSAFYRCYELETLDMPFEAGELLPTEHFEKYTFDGCNSLLDERVIPFKGNDTFVSRVETETAEGGLINYTIYYTLNPVFKDIYKSAQIRVTTKDSNPILARSRPVGLTDAELESAYLTRTYFTVAEGEDSGVFRFSTEPKEGADTTIEVYMAVTYTNGYREYEKLIPADNDSAGWEPVTLTAPANTRVEDGKTEFDIYGSAPIDSDVTIYLNGEAVATAKPNQYTGKYTAAITAVADYGDTLELYAQSGEKKSETANVSCNSYTNEVVKVIFSHYNNHKVYEADLTGAFKYGERPLLAINPAHSLGFEVTLADNDCESVSVASTINGKTSTIELSFNEETGTWKGSGFFASRVIGTLSILAVPRSIDMTYFAGTDENGNTTFSTPSGKELYSSAVSSEEEAEVRAFLEENPMEIVANEKDVLAVKFVPKYADAAKAAKAAPPDLTPLSRYSALQNANARFTDVPSLNVLTVNTDHLKIDGKDYSGDDLIAADTFKLTRPSATIRQPDGSYLEVYEIALTQDQLPLADKIMYNIAVGTQSAADFLKSTGTSIVEGTITIVRNVSTGVSNICMQMYSSTLQPLFAWMGDTFNTLLVEGLSKSLQGFASGALYIFSVITTFFDLYHKGIDLQDIWDQIEFSKNPEVKAAAAYLKTVLMGSLIARFMTAVFVLYGGLIVLAGSAVGAIKLLPAIIISAVVALIAWTINKGLDYADDGIRNKAYAVSNKANLNILYDPSGIAYEWLPSNPVEGVTAQIYYQDSEGKAVLWNAGDYDQVNPQITDDAGWFAWDVPEGMWQVRISGEGYEDAASEWLPVLPVQTGVNIKLTSTLPAEIEDAGYNGGKAVVKFSKHMLDSTVTANSIVLIDKNGNAVDCNIAPVKEEGNNTEASMTFILTPKSETSLAGAEIGVKADAKSYAGIACKESGMLKLRELSVEEMPQQGQTADYTLGDVNEDGKIDAKDASQILVYYSKMSTGAEGDFSDTQKAAANVNNDDKIDAKDASFILAYYAMASTATGDVPTMTEYMAAKAS